MVPALTSAVARNPVVFTSSCPRGGVLAATYGYAGANVDLAQCGMIRSCERIQSKAHAPLVLALYYEHAMSDVRRFFVNSGSE